MVRARLRTKFLLSMVLITTGLTALSLFLVRQSVQSQITKEIFSDLRNSVSTFQSFQREKEITLSHAADLLADLPTLRALMTTHDEATIQDGSAPLWRLAGSDLFVLADREGTVVALQTDTPGFTREMAQASLTSSLESQRRWWFGAKHLYEIFLKPIYFGPASENHLLGFLVIGYEINEGVASQIGRIANSKVVFYYGDDVVISTLGTSLDSALAGRKLPVAPISHPQSTQIGDERFLETTLELSPQATAKVQLTVLRSYDEAIALLKKLNRLLLALDLLAILIGTGLVFFISHTFTRPLAHLLAGVSALEKGDFTYALDVRSRDEVGELSGAFERMRESLLKTQQSLLEAERLATIGRMASSISHDLRHSLAAIVANAEFLCESGLTTDQREELYQEVRIAVNQMTDLIDSLLEFSRTREALRPSYGNVEDSVQRALQAIRTRPEFHQVQIDFAGNGRVEGWFDPKKLERALYNLLLNACEAVSGNSGRIDVNLRTIPNGVEIRVSDNGRGIPEQIRDRLFQPFVSFGKENGTGLGLTVVQKIIQDHGGDVVVEKTSEQGTIFKLALPLASSLSSPQSEKGNVAAPPLSRANSAKRQ